MNKRRKKKALTKFKINLDGGSVKLTSRDKAYLTKVFGKGANNEAK